VGCYYIRLMHLLRVVASSVMRMMTYIEYHNGVFKSMGLGFPFCDWSSGGVEHDHNILPLFALSSDSVW
jgi:hypothetical protein